MTVPFTDGRGDEEKKMDWKPISEAPVTPSDVDDPESLLLWVANGGDRRKDGSRGGAPAFGYVRGTTVRGGGRRAIAHGYLGDDWEITHYATITPPEPHD